MNITTILFDLDGTLLPMDQDLFLKAYFGGLVKKLVPHGYDPKLLVDSIWAGTGAMVKNTGEHTNEEVFWHSFAGFFGENCRTDEPIFQDFYEKEFQSVQDVCGFTPEASLLIGKLKAKGLRLVLATNPLFPAIATQSRCRWAGLDPADFELITTYENSRFCKPNPDYYRYILQTLNLNPEECLMVGNDVGEDMIAEKLGMKVFLLTDCLINKVEKDITCYPHGSFDALAAFIENL